ncbi:MAG: FAD-dependent oxidoreductase [Firmicutes bacterium]|nr:FAD-dependent oxidoreductase [Bacillota bacterium]
MNILIIGGSDAGISAALRIRELNPEIKPAMIVAGRYPNFSICGLPYYISREVAGWRNLAHRTKQDIEAQGIQLLLEHTARAIHPETKQVTVKTPSGTVKALDYDKLLIRPPKAKAGVFEPSHSPPFGSFRHKLSSRFEAVDTWLNRSKGYLPYL